MSHLWDNFRIRLVILVILGVMPALFIVYLSAHQQRRVAAGYVQESALRLASDVSKDQKMMIEMTHRFLRDLAENPSVKSFSIQACSALFKDFFDSRPFMFYANVALSDDRGNIVCSALPVNDIVNVSDRQYFKFAIAEKRFSVGSFQVGRISHARTIGFGYPVIGEGGQVRGVLMASLDLSWFNHLAAAADLPAGATLAIVDSNGTILSRYPDPEKWVGTAAPESEVVQTVLLEREGVAEATGIDGIRKLYGFKPMGGLSEGGFVYVGIPQEPAFSKVDRMLSQNLILVVLSAILGLICVWAFGYVFIMRGLNSLALAARQITEGNLDTRIPAKAVNGEIGRLALAFDQMAEALQRRDAEHKLLTERIKNEKDFSDLLIDSLPGTFFLFDEHGSFLRWNRNFERVTGYSPAEILQLQPSDFFQGNHWESVQETIETAFATGEAMMIHADFVDKSGMTYPYIFTGRRLKLDNRMCLLGTGLDVSEQKKLEEERNRLFSFSVDMLCIATFDGFLKQVNPAWSKTLGWSEADLMNRPFVDFLHPDDKKKSIAMFERLSSGETVQFFENRVRCKDGFFRWISWNSFPLPQEGLAFAVARDVTLVKQSEREVAELQALLSAAIDQTPAGILIADAPHMSIRLANNAAMHILGETVKTLSDSSYCHCFPKWGMYHPFGEPFTAEEFPLTQAILQGKISKNVEAVIQRPDGRSHWILINAAPVLTNDGEITAGVAVFSDITELKNAEAELRRSAAKYRRILETIADGYHEVDLRGNLVLVNDSMCEITGHTREELLGTDYRQLMDEENAKRVFAAYNRVYRTQEPNTAFDLEIIRKDGQKLNVSISISLIREMNNKPTGFRGIFRDVTQGKKMEEQLRHAVKMEAVGRLAGGIAHDFNNILTAIMGYATIASTLVEASTPVRERLEQITKASQRAADLTRQLLAFSRKQMLDVKVIDLNEVISDLEKMLKRLIGEDIELNTLLNSSAAQTKADPVQIEQILMNLVVNARDAMPRGGNLTIETNTTFLDENYCRTHLDVEPGHYVVLSVSDSGRGMDAETLKCIFEPFFTTKEKGAGTGLGLSMVYGIVKQHKGHINVYSEPGKGTTFKIYLPFMRNMVQPAAQRASEMSQPHGTETILVVEDEELVLNLASEALEMLGYTVLRASDPIEATAKSCAHLSHIHLLLTDVVLPNMDGRSLFNALSPTRPGMKVLYVSGYTENFIVHRGVLDRGVHFMQKPFTVEVLARRVREVLDGATEIV
ncbi:PAS domain S-box protein [Desulfomonile tiedjei]|uniref:histidine kinase n=1 Tax=Desulfomonile tiedjei (strain ATCC 49306 / DSM 6799 / DCB-1) TaxID=706587 RepID=I4C3H5_DESTA|nr:PAS domain S-box protein [Desulfomonile tiedjei]AFM24116.1 PAS domain S-box [Desulfomonile tiedjei DSM 6799]